jgi:hypothetical protein
MVSSRIRGLVGVRKIELQTFWTKRFREKTLLHVMKKNLWCRNQDDFKYRWPEWGWVTSEAKLRAKSLDPVQNFWKMALGNSFSLAFSGFRLRFVDILSEVNGTERLETVEKIARLKTNGSKEREIEQKLHMLRSCLCTKTKTFSTRYLPDMTHNKSFGIFF